MLSREREFLELYQKYRYEDQYRFYKSHVVEFKKAGAQAKGAGIVLMLIATLASGLASFSSASPSRLIMLIIAAICLISYTALAAYTTLYAFDQQAKLYRDTTYALAEAHITSPDLQEELSEQDFSKGLHDYVEKVEGALLIEQGQWGQLAGRMKPPEV